MAKGGKPKFRGKDSHEKGDLHEMIEERKNQEGKKLSRYASNDVFIILGFALFLIGMVLILTSFTEMTGNVVGGEEKTSGSFIAFVFLIIGGIVFFLARREKKIQKLEKAAKGGSLKAKDVISYALSLGHRIEEGNKHTKIYDGDRYVTTVPRSPKPLAKGTALSIYEDLARK